MGLIEVFGNKCFRSIVWYHWFDHVVILRLLPEPLSRPVACIVQLRLWLHGHVTRYPKVDLYHRMVFKRESPG